jgi:hypothetical protein
MTRPSETAPSSSPSSSQRNPQQAAHRPLRLQDVPPEAAAFLSKNQSKPTKLTLPVCFVYADGGICLDILQNRWSPTYNVSAILISIQVSPPVLPTKTAAKDLHPSQPLRPPPN